MALLVCPECTGAVSSTAASCPHCGYVPARVGRAKRRPMPPWKIAITALAYVLAALFLANVFPNYGMLILVAVLICGGIDIFRGERPKPKLLRQRASERATS